MSGGAASVAGDGFVSVAGDGFVSVAGATLASLFAEGRAAEIVLALLVVEGLVLFALALRTGRGLPPGQIITGIGAGVCLVLALRAALVDAAWPAVMLPLALGGMFHAADLTLRWHAGMSRASRRPDRKDRREFMSPDVVSRQ